MEASKASTGNLSVEITTVLLGELVSQVTGSTRTGSKKAGLYPVLQLPEGKIPALGDGRYLWRIMDNLFSNVCNMLCPAPGCISTPPSRTAMPSST